MSANEFKINGIILARLLFDRLNMLIHLAHFVPLIVKEENEKHRENEHSRAYDLHARRCRIASSL